MNGAFHAPPLTVPSVFADGQSRGCREIDSPDRGRRDSYESRLLLKFILEKEKKMANDNHLSLRSML